MSEKLSEGAPSGPSHQRVSATGTSVSKEDIAELMKEIKLLRSEMASMRSAAPPKKHVRAFYIQ